VKNGVRLETKTGKKKIDLSEERVRKKLSRGEKAKKEGEKVW